LTTGRAGWTGSPRVTGAGPYTVTVGSSTPDHVRTTLGGVLTVLDLADEAGVAPVDRGGWGVDALLGTQTRDHGDLDVAIDARHLEAFAEALCRAGVWGANTRPSL